MRLWSLHPGYLDAKGLVALWREGLLAQKVLLGKTKGYRNHPQLERFKEHRNPKAAIATYLYAIYLEAKQRGYSFDQNKLGPQRTCQKIAVTREQLKYEMEWLISKLEARAPDHLKQLAIRPTIKPHPSFNIIAGQIAPWEKIPT